MIFLWYNYSMRSPDEEIINDYLDGKIIDPCDYDAFSLEKLDEFLGNDEEY